MTRAVLRSVTIVFALATCGYALLCASAFTYHDFIRSDMFAVSAFARWHRWLAVLWAAAAIADIRATLPGHRRAHAIFAAVWATVAALLVMRPVLPRLAADRLSYVVALAALAPVIWLAAADHAAAARFLADPRHRRTGDDVELTEGRLAVAAAGAVVFLTVAFAVLVPILTVGAFEPDLLTPGLTIGLGWSLVGHAVPFAIVFLVAALSLRVTAGASLVRQYALVLLLAVGAAMLGIDRVVCQVLGFEGVWRVLVALGLSVAIVGSWTAAALRGAVAGGHRLPSGFDLVAGATGERGTTGAVAVQLLAIAAGGYAAARISAAVDWDFLFLTTALMLLWIAAFSVLFRAAPPRRVGSAAIAVGCLLPLVASFALRRAEPRWPDVGLALTRYIVYNPSFRLSERLLRRSDAAGMAALQRYLRANTALAGLDIKPVSIDLVQPLGPAPVEPPHVFLFVIDSLRPDYLAPYNRAVTFTPAIRQFAAESVVFPNAMTRYGATGLSLPAIWSGTVGTHRQYVLPFSPMNTLEKLLIANRYRRVMSLDVLMAPLLAPWPDTIALDRDRRTLDYDLCATLSELEGRFPPVGPHDPPVFGYSNPQNLHPSNLVGSAPVHDAAYAGFSAPYAARVRAIDGCFGGFVAFLKRRQIYDRSLVVLTSDHGELLGEEGRWGHAYYLFPPILQIPLIVHLPAATAAQPIDRHAISFSIDIAPTIYAALGYRLQPSSPLAGEPLVGGEPADAERRRRADYVVEASYSAVYGVVRRNGRHVYVVDAVSGSDYAYDRDRAGRWTPVVVTDSLRGADQRIIREHIDRVRRIYHLPPET